MVTLVAAAAAATAAAAGSTGASGPVRRLDLAAPPGARRWAAVITVLAAVAVSWRLLLSPWAVGTATCVALTARLWRGRATRHRAQAREAEVVTLCFAVAAEVRAGQMPPDALGSAASQLAVLGPRIAAAARAVARGASVDDELVAVAAAVASPRLHTIAAVWRSVTDTGAGVAGVLERVACSFAADDEARAELDALAAGPRATALVLCALPAFAVALGTAVGAGPLRLLLHTSLGWLLMAAAAALDACGLWWVRAITARALAR